MSRSCKGMNVPKTFTRIPTVSPCVLLAQRHVVRESSNISRLQVCLTVIFAYCQTALESDPRSLEKFNRGIRHCFVSAQVLQYFRRHATSIPRAESSNFQGSESVSLHLSGPGKRPLSCSSLRVRPVHPCRYLIY